VEAWEGEGRLDDVGIALTIDSVPRSLRLNADCAGTTAIRPDSLKGSVRQRPPRIIRATPRIEWSLMIVAASTVAVVAIAAAVVAVALVVWYILPRGGRRKRGPRV
jgi:hypothetical protein